MKFLQQLAGSILHVAPRSHRVRGCGRSVNTGDVKETRHRIRELLGKRAAVDEICRGYADEVGVTRVRQPL